MNYGYFVYDVNYIQWTNPDTQLMNQNPMGADALQLSSMADRVMSLTTWDMLP